jgi:hypothetical protein
MSLDSYRTSFDANELDNLLQCGISINKSDTDLAFKSFSKHSLMGPKVWSFILLKFLMENIFHIVHNNNGL